jgi:hypothetical protein
MRHTRFQGAAFDAQLVQPPQGRFTVGLGGLMVATLVIGDPIDRLLVDSRPTPRRVALSQQVAVGRILHLFEFQFVDDVNLLRLLIRKHVKRSLAALAG